MRKRQTHCASWIWLWRAERELLDSASVMWWHSDHLSEQPCRFETLAKQYHYITIVVDMSYVFINYSYTSYTYISYIVNHYLDLFNSFDMLWHALTSFDRAVSPCSFRCCMWAPWLQAWHSARAARAIGLRGIARKMTRDDKRLQTNTMNNCWELLSVEQSSATRVSHLRIAETNMLSAMICNSSWDKATNFLQ